MTLDEAIKHAEEVAKQNEEDAVIYSNCKNHKKNLYEIGLAENAEKKCCKCAEEHRRLAEWLKELKRLREQTRWIPCTPETMPKNKSNVLTVIYIPGRQAHIRSGWYDDGLFMNDNGDTWKATDKEVVGWMYQPKLPTPYREGGQNEQN